jgi:tRNA A-37 threonylcarbamoyl transferase component Bud32
VSAGVPIGELEIATNVSKLAALSKGAFILERRFRILELLGGGGMGLVYLAEQVSLGRNVAIKVLRQDMPNDAVTLERFRREALLLSSVEHPSVVRVIEFGATEFGPCLVMDLAEGPSLESELHSKGALSAERAERILLQLAQGLVAIHQKGIVHRDLKPDNVVLTKTADGQEQARLLDFGIARLAEPEESAKVTQAGFVLGTPEYIAPEQALGQPLDARSDVYSLGVIAFRMLSGKNPFAGPTPREFIAQHINDAPADLSTLGVPVHLAQLVADCLKKSPGERPQTAQALVERLTPIPLASTLTQALRATVATPARRERGRSAPVKRVARLAAATVAALALLGVAFFFWWNEPTRLARRLLEQGRGPEALQVIDDVKNNESSLTLKMLKAVALAQSSRHEESWKLLESLPDNTAVEPLAIETMADAFGRNEPARIKKLLASFPKVAMLPALQKLAQAEQSWSQWGALRFVDVEHAGQGLPLSQLYEQGLNRKDCSVRRTAAKRLGELRAVESIPTLKKLKELPRKRSLFSDDECGQDAAANALQRLEKEVAP